MDQVGAAYELNELREPRAANHTEWQSGIFGGVA
jgi:hypothetical protein